MTVQEYKKFISQYLKEEYQINPSWTLADELILGVNQGVGIRIVRGDRVYFWRHGITIKLESSEELNKETKETIDEFFKRITI